jgi:hypothetical protein
MQALTSTGISASVRDVRFRRRYARRANLPLKKLVKGACFALRNKSNSRFVSNISTFTGI